MTKAEREKRAKQLIQLEAMKALGSGFEDIIMPVWVGGHACVCLLCGFACTVCIQNVNM